MGRNRVFSGSTRFSGSFRIASGAPSRTPATRNPDRRRQARPRTRTPL